MTTTAFAATPAGFDSFGAQFLNGDGTNAKVILEPKVSAGATTLSPLRYGGCSVLDLEAASSDTADVVVHLYRGEVASTVANAGATGAVTTTTSTIVRAAGSWATEGWKPGTLAMIFAPDGAARQAVDGVMVQVTGVTALTLTLNGTPLSALTVQDGARICKISHLYSTLVRASSGTDGSTRSIRLQNGSQDGAIATGERKLGDTDLLAAAVGTAVTAGKFISLDGQVALY